MTSPTRSSIPAFAVAVIALVLAVVTGIDWIGKPLRMVNLVTIIGLSMAAGVAWMQAVARLREDRLANHSDPAP